MLLRIIIAISLMIVTISNLHSQEVDKIFQQSPWEWSGSVSTNMNIYHASGIDNRSNPFFWNLSTNMTGKLYGLSLPFSFTIGKHESNFSRPFIQLGASPSYKWAKLHVGTRSLTYSPYTLAGHVFTGIGVDLRPGKLRFSAMTGRFRKAREFDAELDFRFNPYVYKRSGHALRIGYGTEENYFDISYLKAKDDPNSLQNLPQDSLITPSENAVLGISTKLKLSHHIRFFADAAASAFTRDIFSDPAEDYIEPDISSLFTTRFSTRLNYALKTGLNFNFPAFGFKFSYERIMPEFETMGSYFFANDREIISIAPRFSLLERKMNINGNIGIQKNNVLENRSAQTKQLVGMLNISYFNPNGFGLNANYTNLAIQQDRGLNELIDTVELNMITRDLSLSPSYSWADTSKSHAIIMSSSFQGLTDRNPFTREFTEMNTSNLMLNYNLNFINSGLNLGFGTNYTKIEVYNLNTKRYGFSFNVSKNLSDFKYNLSLSSSYNKTSIEGQSDGSIFTTNLNLAYNPHQKHNVSLFTTILRNRSEQFENYTEIYAGLNYTYQFR